MYELGWNVMEPRWGCIVWIWVEIGPKCSWWNRIVKWWVGYGVEIHEMGPSWGQNVWILVEIGPKFSRWNQILKWRVWDEFKLYKLESRWERKGVEMYEMGTRCKMCPSFLILSIFGAFRCLDCNLLSNDRSIPRHYSEASRKILESSGYCETHCESSERFHTILKHLT